MTTASQAEPLLSADTTLELSHWKSSPLTVDPILQCSIEWGVTLLPWCLFSANCHPSAIGTIYLQRRPHIPMNLMYLYEWGNLHGQGAAVILFLSRLRPFHSTRKVFHQCKQNKRSLFRHVYVVMYSSLILAAVAYILLKKGMIHLTTFVACCNSPINERISLGSFLLG